MILFAELPPLPIALDHVLVSIKKKKKKPEQEESLDCITRKNINFWKTSRFQSLP